MEARTINTVDGATLIVPPALDGAAHATLAGIRGQKVTAARVADLMMMHLHHQGWTVAPRDRHPHTLSSEPKLFPDITLAAGTTEVANQPVTVSIAGRPMDLTLAIGDHDSMVGIFQSRPVKAMNDHAYIRRMTTALVDMVIQFYEGRGVVDPEAMIVAAQDILREEFYPVHAARRERVAQQERPM